MRCDRRAGQARLVWGSFMRKKGTLAEILAADKTKIRAARSALTYFGTGGAQICLAISPSRFGDESIQTTCLSAMLTDGYPLTAGQGRRPYLTSMRKKAKRGGQDRPRGRG